MPTIDREYRGVQPGLELPNDVPYLVLVGPNNGGKSSILQALNFSSSIRQVADYVSPQRFNVANTVELNDRLASDVGRARDKRKRQPGGWSELQAPNPSQELLVLSDKDRERVIRWHNKYFGHLSVEHSDSDNQWSPPIFRVDGIELSEQGSGSRAILSLLTRLFDPSVEILLIDEPEISLQPQTQRHLRELLQAIACGEEDAPQKNIIVATHSHLFVDRVNPSSNFVVKRDDEGNVFVERITSETDLQRLVFSLLGNSPDDLFFPTNVIIVEGPSDQIFIDQILRLKDRKELVCHYAGGEANIDNALPAIDQMLSSTSYLPMYRNRLIVLVDQLRSNPNRLAEWRDFLGDESRVIELSNNGIEYYYPISLLSEITDIEKIDLDESLSEYMEAIGRGELNPPFGTFSGGKRQLAEEISNRLEIHHLDELDNEILSVIDYAVKLAEW